MATFPLKCILCSTEHSYSDISHLLTHMSSKRHLSTYFNTTVRARQDSILAGKLHQFDCWYNQNDLEQLLAERLSKKDEKKLGLKASQAATGYGSRRNSKRLEPVAALPEQPEHKWEEEETGALPALPLDPHILIKREPDLYTGGATDNYTFSFQGPSMNPRATEHSSHEQSWHSFDSSIQNRKTEHQDDAYPWLAEPTNSGRSGSALFGGPPVAGGRCPSHLNAGTASFYSQDASPEINAAQHQNNSPMLGKKKPATLKGIIWPGMLLFDAASPNSKRMRNQRKTYATARTLERLSERSQPTEVIYYPETWRVKEKRPIDGEVHSPLPEVLPLPRKSKQRKVLAEISTNRQSKRNGRFRQKLSEADKPESPTQSRLRTPKINIGQPESIAISSDKSCHGSSHDLETHLSKYDVFEPQPLLTTYPFLSNYSFVRGESSATNTFRMPGQHQISSPAPLTISNTIPSPRRLMPNENSTISETVFLKSEPDDSFGDCLPHLNCSLPPPRFRESLPHINTFDHFYYMTSFERSQRSMADSLLATPNLQTEQRNYHQNASYTNRSEIHQAPAGPRTPIRAAYTCENFAPNEGNALEDSSGDETIDQGIGYTPTRYLTRSAARLMGRSPA